MPIYCISLALLILKRKQTSLVLEISEKCIFHGQFQKNVNNKAFIFSSRWLFVASNGRVLKLFFSGIVSQTIRAKTQLPSNLTYVQKQGQDSFTTIDLAYLNIYSLFYGVSTKQTCRGELVGPINCSRYSYQLSLTNGYLINPMKMRSV